MKIEHIALNVEYPIEMSEWYIDNLGMSIVKQEDDAPFTTFLADSSGEMMIEIYSNPPEQVPDYRNMNPLLLHIAFVSEHPDEEKKMLLESGAKLESDDKLEDGSRLIMLRDPWGICIQLCKRGKNLAS